MKLFGRKSGGKEEGATPPSSADDAIPVLDAYGRKIYIEREEWRSKVLPDAIQKDWDNPSGLYAVILQSLDDGFRAEIVHATQRLYEIDTIPERGTCIYGIVLMEEGRLQEAQDVLENFLKFYGREGHILTNLAKVHSQRGDAAKAEDVLWQALECEPNQINGLQWYCAIHKERGGDKAMLKALQNVADLPKSWLAPLWIAREYLKDGDSQKALALYHQTLLECEKPVSIETLMQISSDLGNAGLLQDVIDLCAPHFQTAIHGLEVGNNLIKAHLDLRDADTAHTLVEHLYGCRRPDWKPTLEFWEQEIAKARLAPLTATAQKNTEAQTAQNAQITVLSMQGAIWLPSDSPAASLFALKNKGSSRLAVIGSSADKDDAQGVQMTDHAGRLSRALPLFLVEQATFQMQMAAYTLTPLIEQSGQTSFLLSGAPWTPKAAQRMMDDQRIGVEYLATVSLHCRSQPWEVELLLIRVSDGTLLKTLRVPLANNNTPSAEAITRLAQEMMQAIHEDGSQALRSPPAYYQPPADADGFAEYLLRIEQLLALRCFKEHGGVYGEREIASGILAYCAAHPRNVTVRLLLATALHHLKTLHPAVVMEVKDLVSKLHHTEPLPEPAQSVITRILKDAGALS